MKNNYPFYLFIISSFFLLTSCGGSDDELSEDIDVNLTASNLTDKGYFDGMLYYQIISNSPQEVSVSKATNNATTVQIPTQVKIDGKFYRCTNIGEKAFEYCTKLTSLKLSSSVTSISDYAFSGCSGMTSITIPNNVTSIGFRAFADCVGLTSVSLPNQLENISNASFSGCKKNKVHQYS